ncbi:MAG TPA: malto-oligosyltrehalose synthase [Verrucomicrobiae bacterium]
MDAPRATYRFQFSENFRLAQAIALAPYLRALGISHIYASPLFAARPHSTHGYDVCDFSRLNPELGTEAELEHLVGALRKFGMGLILDIVPNHMGIGTPENAWWWDVLKHGRISRFAGYFDIDWESRDEELRGKVLLPILGDTAAYQLKYAESSGNAVQASELMVGEQNGEFILRYFDHVFPLAPESLDKNVSPAAINGNLAALHALLRQQHYLLADWREADRRLNYRRFFAVSSLAAVRVEQPEVFDAVHCLLKRWVEQGWLDGVRVDHPDGLREPENYLRQLRELAPRQWIVVEKILQPEEPLSKSWPVQGTTGYEFLNQVNGLFIDGASEKALTDFYGAFTGEPADAGRLVLEKKRLVLQTLFVTEVNQLTDKMSQVVAHHAGPGREPPLRECITELVAAFPVYRTFIPTRAGDVSPQDAATLRTALSRAERDRPDLPAEWFDFIIAVLLLKRKGDVEARFVARFQQLTGAVMAKGVEDTTFYCFNRFLSLNEVGGNPGQFGIPVDEFHRFCQRQQADWPQTMLTTSTHDTKRSEDVRARMNVLSEMPDTWCEAVLRWSRRNERHRQNGFPDRNAEYLYYQTLAGAWPISVKRLQAYMEKATREAKQHTDWTHPRPAYDEALKAFVAATLADREFIADLEQFLLGITEAGQINSLAQTLIKLTAPGVPDIYQGNELWDYSLVDPDNRRPVDFDARQRLLAEVTSLPAREAWQGRDSGVAKLWLIQKTLAFRADHADLFGGDYAPLFARGAKADHIVAFVRGGRALTIVPRFVVKLDGAWSDTVLKLPAGTWRQVFSDETISGEVPMDTVFEKFPVALLALK